MVCLRRKDILVTFIIGGSRGGVRDARPPPGRPNSFDFMQFSGKFGVFTPPFGKILDPPLFIFNQIKTWELLLRKKLTVLIYIYLSFLTNYMFFLQTALILGEEKQILWWFYIHVDPLHFLSISKKSSLSSRKFHIAVSVRISDHTKFLKD